jgi:adenylate cyclase
MSADHADAHESPQFDAMIETVLGAVRRFSSREIAAAADVPVYRARKFWRALGFPNVPDNEAEFSSEDRRALALLVSLMSDGQLTEHQTVRLTRVLGRAASRLANSQAETLLELVAQSDDKVNGQSISDYWLPALEGLLTYSWRRHLAAALHRLETDLRPTRVIIGFADLVGFTRLSRRLSDADLALTVGGFEGSAADLVIARGGRLVKSLGDEVLFAADTPNAAAEIAIDLVNKVGRRHTPGIRIGLEYGSVVKHAGDVFGDTVNLASRLTAMANPNQILVGPALAAELATFGPHHLESLGTVDIRGMGRQQVSVLHRPGPRTSAAATGDTH